MKTSYLLTTVTLSALLAACGGGDTEPLQVGAAPGVFCQGVLQL